MNLNKKNIYQLLSQIIDPELGIDIVSLGFIYQVRILNKNKIYLKMTLTTPGCPLIHVFDQEIRHKFKKIKNFDVDKNLEIDLVFDPPWMPDMMSDDAKVMLGYD